MRSHSTRHPLRPRRCNRRRLHRQPRISDATKTLRRGGVETTCTRQIRIRTRNRIRRPTSTARATHAKRPRHRDRRGAASSRATATRRPPADCCPLATLAPPQHGHGNHRRLLRRVRAAVRRRQRPIQKSRTATRRKPSAHDQRQNLLSAPPRAAASPRMRRRSCHRLPLRLCGGGYANRHRPKAPQSRVRQARGLQLRSPSTLPTHTHRARHNAPQSGRARRPHRSQLMDGATVGRS